MIIIDTNVISELAKPTPDPNVVRWLDRQDHTTCYVTAITTAELSFGIDRLPHGARRQQLFMAVGGLLERAFYGRILPFDATAAEFFGSMVAEAQRTGVQVSFPDGAIAAIAKANNYAPVVTRDVTPFKAMRVDVINPWEPEV